MDCIALRHTHTTSLRCHPHVPTFEPCPTWGIVQMRVTPGPQNQAQRIQSVSPMRIMVNGLHCAASHTHDFSQVSPSRANFLNHAQLGHGSNEGNTGTAEPSATNPERKSYYDNG